MHNYVANVKMHIIVTGIYLTLTMAITTLSMVLTVCVLNLHHITDRPVPPWTQRLVLHWLASFLRMRGIRHAHQHGKRTQGRLANGDVSRRKRKQRKAMLKSIGANGSVLEVINENAEGFQKEVLASEATPLQSPLLLQPLETELKLERPLVGNHNTAIQDDTTAEGGRNESKTVDYAKEWTRVAEILDRFFFVVFLLSILISTGILFHPLTGLVSTKPVT